MLVGTSNVGKSAVLRALRWVLMNNPAGDKFITHGKDVAKVILELDNGLKIERERGRGLKIINRVNLVALISKMVLGLCKRENGESS